jgi:hypothetical protein
VSLGVLLTVIFAVLKLIHEVTWNWNQVFLPLYIELGFDALLFVLFFIFVLVKASKD